MHFTHQGSTWCGTPIILEFMDGDVVANDEAIVLEVTHRLLSLLWHALNNVSRHHHTTYRWVAIRGHWERSSWTWQWLWSPPICCPGTSGSGSPWTGAPWPGGCSLNPWWGRWDSSRTSTVAAQRITSMTQYVFHASHPVHWMWALRSSQR